MRVVVMALVCTLSVSASALAQEWTEYTSVEDGFRVDFPGTPKATKTTFKSEYGADLPATVYSVENGPTRFSITVADYTDAPRLLDEKAKGTCPKDFPDERSCGLAGAGRGYWKEDIAGAMLHASFMFVQRDAKVTHMAWAWQDFVEGHEIMLTNNKDKSRTFAYVTMHADRLYILEGTVPGNYPPPGLFQQSMGFVDKDGRGIRYQAVYSNKNAQHPMEFPGQPQRNMPRGGGPGPAAGQGAPAR